MSTEFESQEITRRPTISGCQASPLIERRSRTKSLDQRLGLLARELAARGAQVSEPAEAVKLALPPLRRRLDLEGRFGAELGEPPGEAEMAVIELGGEARICGPELLRGKQELLGLRARDS